MTEERDNMNKAMKWRVEGTSRHTGTVGTHPHGRMMQRGKNSFCVIRW